MGLMELAWIIPASSFFAFVGIIAFGRRIPFVSPMLSIGAIIVGCILVFVVVVGRIDADPTGIDFFSRKWFEVGGTELMLGMIIDPLSVVMLGLVCFVSLMVQIYSLSYMRHDPKLAWYYAIHALFAASMILVVLADNFLLFYVAWELVGLCSYLLIGFWWEKREPVEAAKKAFITTRIADVALLVGILLLFHEVGTFSMKETFYQAQLLGAGEVSELSSGTTMIATLLLFIGAMGKSAQIPFHVWLPDAMAGPTPVSALIHAATMVVAGVYLVARTFALFEAVPDVLLVVSIVGLVTSLLASTMALVNTDLKRILAYSTISHLGLMMLSLGAFGYTAAIFHLVAHGFSKALLFLGAGSVSHASNQTDIRKMGGFIKVMPITAITFGIGALSLAGIPIFAGFWSKDEILIAVFNHRNFLFLIGTLLVGFLSALYMARAFYSVFFGDLKNENKSVSESPILMTAPLILLAIPSLLFGFSVFGLDEGYGGIGRFIFFENAHDFHFNVLLGSISVILAVVAFGISKPLYITRKFDLNRIKKYFSGLISICERGYYFDPVYEWFFDRIVLVSSRFIAWLDRAVVNDVGVNGPANSMGWTASRLRLHVTGKVYNYALVMVLGSMIIGSVWWIMVSG